MCTVEKVSPLLLHLPEDIKPDELFHCISQARVPCCCVCIPCTVRSVPTISTDLFYLLVLLSNFLKFTFQFFLFVFHR